MNPLISVIVPVYNVEKELPECLESIIHQTYQNLEIILIDDGATDRSGAICDEYAARDSRISVLHKKNAGLSAARNDGLSCCHGTYVALIDSDDIIKDNMIQTLFSLIVQYQAEISFCSSQKFNQACHFGNETVQTEVFNSESALEQLLYQRGARGITGIGRLYFRELFNGVLFPPGLYYEDLATIYKLLAKADRIAFTTEKMYGYRIRPESISRQKFSGKKMSCIPVSRQLYTDICRDFPNLKDAAASRAFSVNRSVYWQIPRKKKEERNAVWQEMKKYRCTVLTDKEARKRERLMAFCTYLGQPFFSLFSYPYRRHQMSLK